MRKPKRLDGEFTRPMVERLTRIVFDGQGGSEKETQFTVADVLKDYDEKIGGGRSSVAILSPEEWEIACEVLWDWDVTQWLPNENVTEE